jgi:succinate-acetate transporter protein
MSVSSSSHRLLAVVTLRSDLVCRLQICSHVARPQLTSAGNPSLLGLIGFLVPYTSTILILCGFHGAVAPQSLVGLTGDYYFFGAFAMNIAGIAEFILGNSKRF